jgi:hypothetical protein
MPPMLILSIIGLLLNAFLGVQSPMGGYLTKLDAAHAEIVETLN